MSVVQGAVSKAIMYTRGDNAQYSVTVAYNANKDMCTFHDIDVPKDAAKYIVERFLSDALDAMYVSVEKDIDKLAGNSGWVYGGQYHD